MLADALSRRDQDLPKGESDERVQGRYDVVLKPEVFPSANEIDSTRDGVVQVMPVRANDVHEARLDRNLEATWSEAQSGDPEYQDLLSMAERGDRQLPK